MRAMKLTIIPAMTGDSHGSIQTWPVNSCLTERSDATALYPRSFATGCSVSPASAGVTVFPSVVPLIVFLGEG